MTDAQAAVERAQQYASQVRNGVVLSAANLARFIEDLAAALAVAEARVAELEEKLRISYPATPVDCLLSTLSELTVWTPASVFVVKEFIGTAVAECHAALADAEPKEPTA